MQVVPARLARAVFVQIQAAVAVAAQDGDALLPPVQPVEQFVSPRIL